MATKQKKSIGQKFSGLSGTKKLLMFVLVFTLLGGGYLAYRSFAATPGTLALADNLQLSGKGKLITERKGSKKKSSVWELSPGGFVSNTFNTNSNRAYKVCAIFKLPLGGQITIGGGTGQKGGSEVINIEAGNKDYQTRCSNGGPVGSDITAYVGLKNGSDLRVSALFLTPQ